MNLIHESYKKTLQTYIKKYIQLRKFPGTFIKDNLPNSETLGYICLNKIPIIEVIHLKTHRVYFGSIPYQTLLERQLGARFSLNIISLYTLDSNEIDKMSISVNDIIKQCEEN